MSDVTLDDILLAYNNIKPSRTRWVRNRNTMRKEWKELFTILEQASGRSGVAVKVYDPNWHKTSTNGQLVTVAPEKETEEEVKTEVETAKADKPKPAAKKKPATKKS